MTDDIITGRDGAMGVITLNRPRAINALDAAMIETIHAALEAWRDDESVAAVLFEGRGEKGFCAGGDVRATRQGILDGRIEEALTFYEREYRTNLFIATYPKPIVVIAHGIVMGGGIGLAGHAHLRIAVEGARYAMPESAIGLFCDVGVNARLARVPAQRALLFEFAGLPVGPGDAIVLDLCDLVVPVGSVDALRAGLIAAADGGKPALEAAAKRFAVVPGPAEFLAVADRLAPAFTGRNAGAILERLKQIAGPDDAELIAILAKRSPTSLEAILETYWRALEDPDIGHVLARDLALARFLSVRSDFAEGVRAVLVDKDNAPTWVPDDMADVDRQAIADVLA